MQYHKKFGNIDISCSYEIDQVPPSKEESNLLRDIRDISCKITNRKIPSIQKLSVFADILETLETNKEQYESGSILNLKPLEEFAISAEKLTHVIEGYIKRCNKLGTFNTTDLLRKIKGYMIKIDKLSKVSDTLNDMMMHPHKHKWYNNYINSIEKVNSNLTLATNKTFEIMDESDNSDPEILMKYSNIFNMIDDESLKRINILSDRINCGISCNNKNCSNDNTNINPISINPKPINPSPINPTPINPSPINTINPPPINTINPPPINDIDNSKTNRYLYIILIVISIVLFLVIFVFFTFIMLRR
jgi:hypothetical protein